MIFNLNTGLKLRFHESGREQNSSLDDHVLYDQIQVFDFGPKPKPKMAITLVPIAKLTETTKFHYDHGNTEHNVPLTHSCEKCECYFKTKNELNKHNSDIHKEKMLFKCASCSLTFKEKKLLREHYIHKEEIIERISRFSSVYICPICNEKFTAKISLNAHISNNHQTYNYIWKCDICDATFKQIYFLKEKYLTQHVASAHNEGNFK